MSRYENVEFKLTLETFPRKDGGMDAGKLHCGIMTVKADTPEEAIEALQRYIRGEIDMRTVPKTGLDVRRNRERNHNDTDDRTDQGRSEDPPSGAV